MRFLITSCFILKTRNLNMGYSILYRQLISKYAGKNKVFSLKYLEAGVLFFRLLVEKGL